MNSGRLLKKRDDSLVACLTFAPIAKAKHLVLSEVFWLMVRAIHSCATARDFHAIPLFQLLTSKRVLTRNSVSNLARLCLAPCGRVTPQLVETARKAIDYQVFRQVDIEVVKW